MTAVGLRPELPGEAPGSSGVRENPNEIVRFVHPLTRTLLAGGGFTTPALEAILGTELHVRVLRQDDMTARWLPADVTAALRVSGADRVLVRRSCLVDADRTVSVNYVVAPRGPAFAAGIDDLRTPIGFRLIARGASQRRDILWAGVRRWPDGRRCAARAYVMLVDDQPHPLCYVHEAFDPAVVPPEHAPPSAESLRIHSSGRSADQ